MPDAEQGDVFLRNRRAVLDALLSASALEPSRDLHVSEPESASVGAPVLNGASVPLRRRPAGGSRASARISSLLNGHDPDGPPAPDSPIFRTPSAGTLTERAAPVESQVGATPPATSGGSTARTDLRRLLTQLRKPKVALPLAGVAALLLILALVAGGGEPRQNVVIATPTDIAPAPSVPTSSVPSGAEIAGEPLKVRAAESRCPPGGTAGMDAFAGQPGRAWSCPRAFRVDGQVLRIDLGAMYEIDSIGIVPGWDHVGPAGEDQWSKFRTVSRISYQFDDADATTYTQQTLDQRTLVVTKIAPPIRASRITLTVLETNGEPALNVVAISSIVITGR
ncbi:discoidin domain-containing protein [Nocardia iowensis]|uniref:Discoidin domain-containing protein n=1 Tax=Nocardia iowensis TaxID=204891 RepID=A0ABX8RYF2_NOCIO|nr:discoidin domain-containing protein [Nocardia iowensis]QXN94683.1 discoidin domain-containing protein [Nocardia iowensis]